jgi:LysM repeat protein
VTFDNKIDTWTRLQAYRVYEFVTAHWRNAGKKAVFLAGYSRGGAAVIEVAKWLKADNIPVECLILFDAVDRTAQVGLPWRDTPIVDTVRYVIYPTRDPASESRESFGNCGLFIHNPSTTKLYKDCFRGTHGAMGGTPWTEPKDGGYIDEGPPDGLTKITVEQDKLASMRVRDWVFPLVFEVICECRQRLEQEYKITPTSDFTVPNQSGSPHLGSKKRIHIVKTGDWLSKIAQTYYGDINKWKTIYEVPENKATIGPNPNLIKPGQQLIIP